MSFKYIGKQRQIAELGRRTFAQLINVPALEGTRRCQSCVFYEYERTNAEYLACIDKHKCGRESLLWSRLTNSMDKSWWKPQYFSPTLQLRQVKIDYAPRYLQYISADISGYECNSYCQYYPARIDAGTTVAECAANHACGKNGSFFDILTLDDMEFDTIPDFDIIEVANTDFITFDGQIISNPSSISMRITQGEFLQIKFDDDQWYGVVNWLPSSTCAGNLLMAPSNLARTYHFEQQWWAVTSDKSELLVLTDTNSRLATYLRSLGMVNLQFQYPYYNYIEFHLPDNTRVLFTSRFNYFGLEEINGRYILFITDLLSLNKYMVKMTSRTGKLLGAPIDTTDISVIRWIDNPWANTEPYPSITITDYDDQYSSWLRSCGLRKTLFY